MLLQKHDFYIVVPVKYSRSLSKRSSTTIPYHSKYLYNNLPFNISFDGCFFYRLLSRFILFGKNGYRNRISNFLTNRKAPLVGCRLATALENRPRIKKRNDG